MGSAGFWSEGAECGERLVLHLTVIVVGWYLVVCRGGVVGSIVVGVGSGERVQLLASGQDVVLCKVNVLHSILGDPTTNKPTYLQPGLHF